MRLATLGNRYIAYLVEQSFLIPVSSLLVYLLGTKTLILGFFLLFKLNFQGSLDLIFTTSAGWVNLAVLFLISLLYYTLETVSGIGIGSRLFGFRIITKYELPSHHLLILYTLRNLVKSFFISNVINAISILAFRRNLQTLLDYRLNVVIATEKDDLSKTFRQGVISSMVMYYASFALLIIIFSLENSGIASTSSSSVGSHGVNAYSIFTSILNNNLTLDITGYMLGGFTLLMGTFVRVFMSSILETVIISSVLNTQEVNNFVHYVLPEFFPETMGYVFGIAAAISIANIILNFIQALIRNEKKDYFFVRSKIQLKNAVYYSILSIVLIIVGAAIESIVGAI
jgi:hypothetical protein